MSIEKQSERLERNEAYLKQRLSDYKSTMPVKGWNEVTLLEIYWEWMDYLVKENLKQKSDLLIKWQDFLLQRDTDDVANLLIGFFEAKRRYGRDKERGEDKWDWFTLCDNYTKKSGWNESEDLLKSLFSSYSWAERRIYRKVERGEMLTDVSKSVLQTINLTKAEMTRKEEERRRKAEEKLAKQAEKQKRKEERGKKKEEKEKQKVAEKNAEEIPNPIDEWAENHYWGNDRDVIDENGDVIPNPKHVYKVEEGITSNSEDENFDDKETENKRTSKKKKSVPQQLEFPFDEY